MTCECGLTFSETSPSDRALHRRHHDIWQHGVPWPPTVQERVIGKRPDGSRLVIVGPDSRLFLRKRVERLGRRANQDTHYDFGVYHAQESWTREADVHGVVAVTPDHRGVAVGLFEKRSLRLVTTWEEWSAPTPLGDSSAVPGGFWTVGFVWTLVTYRRQGLGRWIIEAGANALGVVLDDLAWYPPFSDSGEALARALCPNRLVLGR